VPLKPPQDSIETTRKGVVGFSEEDWRKLDAIKLEAAADRKAAR
jgi:hypothetical protein